MAVTILCSVLLLSYSAYVVYCCIRVARKSRETGKPIQCCGCSAYKTGQCSCTQKESKHECF